MDYKQAIEFLSNRTKFGINLGLERIETMLDIMGQPQHGTVRYVHVGGTNGKGSTGAMLAAVLAAAGYRTGFYSSPHLHSYVERFRINGQEMSPECLAAMIADVLPVIDAVEARGVEPPTEFEVLTALALQYFAQQQCSYAVMEVGMGGDIDSTNVIMPEVSVITNVALDHMDYLGHTVAEIAKTKSGIIKANRPIVCGSRDASAREVILKAAQEKDAPCYLIGRDFDVLPENADVNGQYFTFFCGDIKYEHMFIPLLGGHQLNNAACAVMTAQLLQIKEEHIRAGLAAVQHSGRLEVISKLPLIVLDGAHNTDGMQALASALSQYWPQKRIVAVLGMLQDKEREAAMELLLPYLTQAVVTKVNSPRAGDWRQLSQIVRKANIPCDEVEDVAAAVYHGAQYLVRGQCDMLLVAGSLYMLADARACLLSALPEHPLILASGSPRRLELLRGAGIEPEICVADTKELCVGLPPELLVQRNAKLKACAVAALQPGRYVLGADTVVALDGQILGKPHDADDAKRMLQFLSGRQHQVYTGICLCAPDGREFSDVDVTDVYFRQLSENDIADYIATGEPFDKAGAYAIQGAALPFVKEINGALDNVVGLPINSVMRLYTKLIFSMPTDE